MAQFTTVAITAGTWTQITNADATSITFQNVSGNYIKIAGTTGTTAPTNDAASLRYNPGQGERNTYLTDLFPGLSGVKRVWAWAEVTAMVSVNHA